MKKFLSIILCLSLSGCLQLARIQGRSGLKYTATTTTLNRQFVWNDRRPIGIWHLSDPTRCTPENPLGWLDGPNWVDAYLVHAIPVLKTINAQGVIIWDLEGSEFPQAMYLGAPDLVYQMYPSLVPAYRKLFSRIRAEGFIPGVCIRPTEFDPVLKIQVESADVYRTLYRKVAFAHRNWGCRLFYVDSNTRTPHNRPNGWAEGWVYPATLFARLHKAFPDCLFIPEHRDSGPYYLWTAPYVELRLGEVNVPDYIRQDIPDSFTFINVSAGDTTNNIATLHEAAVQGSVIAIDAWWFNPQIPDVVEIMKP